MILFCTFGQKIHGKHQKQENEIRIIKRNKRKLNKKKHQKQQQSKT